MSSIPFRRRALPSGSDAATQDTADMQAVAAGDERAFGRLVERYWEPLLHYAGTFLDAETAEDTVQETLIRIWERREDWRPVGRVSAYLYSITRNLALDRTRRRKVRERKLASFHDARPAVGRPALRLLEDEDLRLRITRALEELPERRREAFVLAHMHDLSYREAGEVMGISPQTVANQISAALRDLRGALADLHRDVV